MSDDDQFCLLEGQPHEPHCVEDQGHWHCPGLPGSVESELRASKQMHEEARRLAASALAQRDEALSALIAARSAGWDAGYYRGVRDQELDLEPADNPYMNESP